MKRESADETKMRHADIAPSPTKAKRHELYHGGNVRRYVLV